VQHVILYLYGCWRLPSRPFEPSFIPCCAPLYYYYYSFLSDCRVFPAVPPCGEAMPDGGLRRCASTCPRHIGVLRHISRALCAAVCLCSRAVCPVPRPLGPSPPEGERTPLSPSGGEGFAVSSPSEGGRTRGRGSNPPAPAPAPGCMRAALYSAGPQPGGRPCCCGLRSVLSKLQSRGAAWWWEDAAQERKPGAQAEERKPGAQACKPGPRRNEVRATARGISRKSRP